MPEKTDRPEKPSLRERLGKRRRDLRRGIFV